MYCTLYRNSASCTHVSAVLHALNGLKQSLNVQPNLLPVDYSDDGELNPVLPCTSLPCKWIIPKHRKDSTQQMSAAVFKKHDREKPVKRALQPTEDFDPRPEEYRGTAKNHLPNLFKKVKGNHLGISLLLDEDYVDQGSQMLEPSTFDLPDIALLRRTVEAFKKSLDVSHADAREIERKTREQRLSSLWYSVRRYRLTASRFGDMISRKPTTPPENLVLNILQPTDFSSVAMKYGIDHEKIALKAYVAFQQQNGHPDLLVSPSGFIINPKYSYLGASPDGAVYDPSSTNEPFGFVEIKCPYAMRNMSPKEAAHTAGFCCIVDSSGNIQLKENHSYYAQIQGQMALGERPWCDFVVYTQKDISIQRITFNQSYWEDSITKLVSFYDDCIAPECVSPCHSVGLPVRKLT